ncbi:fibroblast growth factor receptor [Culicoides brevitarsis]|uniref:fibroblast growth factor receptor n=1 Tax=Culicoides brevitarsis TaxID=469753 RepID=UPI00307C23C8
MTNIYSNKKSVELVKDVCLWVLLFLMQIFSVNGTISEIKVTPILKAKNHGNFVQFEIKWNSSLPSNGISYDIIITTLTHDSSKTYCQSDICSEYSYTKGTTIILPEYPEIKDHGECILKLGCDYHILIETSDKRFNQTTNYSVDDCINGICSCYHEFFLPKVDKFAAEFNTAATELQVRFSYDNVFNYHNVAAHLEAIRLRLLKPIKANSHLAWGGRTEEIFDNIFMLKSYQNRTKKVIRESFILPLNNSNSLKRNQSYILRATLIDNRDCEGRIQDTIIYLPLVTNQHISNNVTLNSHYNWIIFAVTSTTISVTFLCVIGIICFNKYRKSRKIVNNWRGVYKNVPTTISRTSMNIQMQENALYIEKEILDAKARGELDILEIPHAAVRIGKEIGKGAFGRVFCATALGIPGKKCPTVVAVKQLKRRPSTDELEEFLGEIATMKKVGKHPNIVSLMGFCTVKQPLMMIMEFVGCGDLLGYLRKIREKRVELLKHLNWDPNVSSKTPCTNHNEKSSSSNSRSSYSHSIFNNNSENRKRCSYADMFHQTSISSETSSFITQPDTIVIQAPSSSVADTVTTLLGSELEASSLLQYSEKQGQLSDCLNYVLDHNELHSFAIQIARGMSHLEEKKITHRDLAARNILIDEHKCLKISDFGLSRTGIYINTKNKRVPLRWLSLEAIRDNLYSSKSDVWAYGIVLWEIGTLGGFPYPTVCNTEILSFLSSGKRLERPENCTEQLYDLMLQCWSANPNDRPDFRGILSQLDPQKQPIYIDFNELDPNYAFPPTVDEVGNIHLNNANHGSSDSSNFKR